MSRFLCRFGLGSHWAPPEQLVRVLRDPHLSERERTWPSCTLVAVESPRKIGEEHGRALSGFACALIVLLVANTARSMSPTRHIWRSALIGLMAAVACFTAFALNSDRTIAQFAHTAWGPKDGAPTQVTALAQSADGYLWLASPAGLCRFDGVAFERYQPQSGGAFPNRTASSLLALPNGDLWIGFWPGVISLLRNGNVTNYTTRDGVPDAGIWGLAQDREGTIWAASASGPARLEGNQWKAVGTDWNFQGKSATAIFPDRQGKLWVATGNTLVFLPPGATRFQPTGIRVGQVLQIAQAANGKLWMAETARSVRPVPLRDDRLPSDNTEVQVGSEGILFAGDGSLRINSIGDGLRRSPAPELLRGRIKEFSTEVESFTARDGLSDDSIRGAILQDREGNIWVGTNNGLDRFRKSNLVPIVLPFRTANGNPVLVAGNDGDVWIDNLGGMFQVHGGRADHAADPIPSLAASAYRDPAGVIWWLDDRGIYRYEAGNFNRFGLPHSFPQPYTASAMVATEDGSGALWLSAEREGLFYRKEGVWHRLESAPDFAKSTSATAFTDWMGRAWFGYEAGNIIILKDGKIETVFLPEDSHIGSVRVINGRGRHLWVGGEFGLAFFDGNRFQRVVPADAETFGWVVGVEEPPDGSLWLTRTTGAIEIPATELHKFLTDPTWRVRYRTFDSSDGPANLFIGAIQGTDGRLWLNGVNEPVSIDPANISTNALPPPVSIRSVKANGRQHDSLTNLVLPPRVRDLQIDYTALSLAAPEKVLFRYRLEGHDTDWQEPGTRRQAFYSDLWPGHYRFQVIACNNDGVWNETGAFLNFTIDPAWYQTASFFAFCAIAFLMLLWTLYQLRSRQLKYQFSKTLETRVDERTRIARELHDTLLQSFQGITLHFQRARNLLPDRAVEAIPILDEALDGAEEAIVEGRDAIHDLRSPTTAATALAEEITALGEELAAKGTNTKAPVELRIVIEGSACPLRQNAYIDIFRIAREALRNAFSHSQGHLIETEMAYTGTLFRLRIRDDGKGIDPDERGRAERSGHWGLKGMRERAERLGGELDVWSEPGAGTEIELRVPASIAYETVLSPGSSWQFLRRKRNP